MERTNIYLETRQLETLRRLSQQRGEPVSTLVRDAIDEWLKARGAHVLGEDEWQERFARLLAARDKAAPGLKLSDEKVDRDVAAAIREVRKARAARRR
jgi:hypothetical protein